MSTGRKSMEGMVKIVNFEESDESYQLHADHFVYVVQMPNCVMKIVYIDDILIPSTSERD